MKREERRSDDFMAGMGANERAVLQIVGQGRSARLDDRGHRAAPQGVGDVGVAVRPCTGQRDEEIALSNLDAIVLAYFQRGWVTVCSTTFMS